MVLKTAPSQIVVPLRMDEGDVLRIGKSRVTLETLIADFHRGASPEEIVHHFPTLNLADVYHVIGYYLENRAEVDAYLQEQENLADEIQREHERRYPQDELRAKLLARMEEKQRQDG